MNSKKIILLALVLILTIPNSFAQMQIFVRQSDSMPRYVGGGATTLTLDCDSSDSVENIKQRINEKLSLVPVGNLMLIFAGTILEDGRTLADYNIQKESTVHVFAVNLYPATSVEVGGTASVLSVAAPGANYTNKTVSTAPGFTGTLSVLPSGEVSIENAAPAGTYVIQINTSGGSPFQSFTLTVYNSSYTVLFNANGGTGTMAVQPIDSNTSANLITNTFTRTGYAFAGWNTAANGSGTSYANGASYTMNAAPNVTLYAQWTAINYTVTFATNGGIGTMSDQTIAFNASANLTSNAFTRWGYTFTGWNVNGNSYTNQASYTMSEAANVTLQAQWQPLQTPGSSYQIFVRQSDSMPRYVGGIGTTIFMDVDSDNTINQIKHYLADLTLVPFENLGLFFSGTILEDNKTLAYYNIQYESQIHVFAVRLYPDSSVAVGDSASVLSVAAPGADYTNKTVSTTPDFTGSLSILPSGEISIQNASPAGTYEIQINNDYGTLFQKFILTVKNNYTVTFDANGGLGSMATQTITSGAAANLRTNAFTRTGYTFAGWATTSGGAVAYANSASYTMGSAAVTLFAKWSLNGSITTQLRPIQCEKTLSYLTSAIQASPLIGATEYTFEVTRTDNNAVDTVVSPNYYFFPATKITGGLVYGKSYSVKVKAKIGGIYNSFGNACIVTAPAEPLVTTTKIRPMQCGKTMNYITDAIQASPVYKAVRYEFEVNDGVTTLVIPSNTYWFRLSSFPRGGVYGTAYTIRVRSSNAPAPAAFAAWGDPCVVITPRIIAAGAGNRLSGDAIANIFNVKGFPNPFASKFSVDIESSSDALVELKVYDMLGRTLEVRKATVSELSVLEVGRNYPSGVYNIVVSQGENVKSLRIMKQ